MLISRLSPTTIFASIEFYEKVGFKRSLHKTSKNRKNPTMHYDIVSGKPL